MNTTEDRKKSSAMRNAAYYWKYYSPPLAVILLTLFLYSLYFKSTYYWSRGNYTPVILQIFPKESYLPLPSHVADDAKVILFWTKFFQDDIPYLHDKQEACHNKKCFLTDDRKYLSRSSAVVFHVRDLKMDDLPTERSPEQLYVFFLLESPLNTGVDLKAHPWADFFNLTWTYRWDSDVFCPLYLDNWSVTLWTDANATEQYLKQKKDGAVVFASNCHTQSRREDYVYQLQKHFPVEIIGECGSRSCPKREKECERDITQRYKFYLSFENSYCKDYITEKAIRPFNYGTVPIVLGDGNYSKLFPKHSFIDTNDYNSASDLADYLLFLVRNPDLYERYYEWRFNASLARLPPFADPSRVDVCKLCDLLHNSTSLRKGPLDIYQWWETDANCRTPRGI